MPREPDRPQAQRQRPADSTAILTAARRQRRRGGVGPRRFCLGTVPLRESDLRVGPLAARRAAFAASASRATTAGDDTRADCDPRNYGSDADDRDADLLDQVAEAGGCDDDPPAEAVDSDDDDESASAEAWRLARARRWRRPARHPLTLALVLPFNRGRVWPVDSTCTSSGDSQ
ncbi:hypothetical protein psal_cds_45 [Pandoravirus salinus]|uniref:Uncharacterized protein n=1 Tax=Pandoravirus salinus TaxID=1349410 RepID=A0A291AT97_9VIRU|nr:hypothetical protein psal_cds_45 [Pandoravirus salinus]ATE82110.1 hypothetical protein psal_cds_45 [Pandoravirus salinus]